MVTGLKKTLKADEQRREDIVKAREQWQARQPLMEASQLFFVDESAAKTNRCACADVPKAAVDVIVLRLTDTGKQRL